MSQMLNIYSQTPISTLTLLKLKTKQYQLKNATKKEEPLNLNLAESSEVKAFEFLVSLWNEILKTSS